MKVPKLIILKGERGGETIELPTGKTGLGRDPSNQLVFESPGISGHHCVFEVTGELVLVRDLGSTNQTLVNGQPVTAAELHSGDLLIVGDLHIRYEATYVRPTASSVPAGAPGEPTPAAVDHGGPPLHEQMGPDTQMFDKRAVMIGLLISALVFLGMAIWKLAPNTDMLKKSDEFEFKVAEHKIEDVKLRDPIRDILKETPEEIPELEDTETPNIQISTQPEVVVEQAVIQTKNIQIDTPQIDVTATELDIQDAPLEISQTAAVVTFAVSPIAVDTAAPADFVKYTDPNPPDKPLLHTINQAPQPRRNMSALPKAFGEQDTPTIGQPGPMNVNLFGTGDFFRTMERAGGAKARAAVDAALHWLAIHQEPDGLWDSAKYEGEENSKAAVTGLAALAFMGGGHTTRKGEYRRNVLKALEAIMRCQDAKGRIAWKGSNHYTHAICTIALCEAYGRARDERVGAAAQKAVDYCVSAVLSDSGWRYGTTDEASDMSVTAWFIQALKTAKLANIKFDNSVFSQSLTYVDSVTDKGASQDSTGAVGYMFKADQEYSPQQNGSSALTSAGMMIRQFNGMGVKNHILVKGAELTKATPPQWNNKDFYYWYYATYAMHNMGGEYRLWWNQRVRDVLLTHQSREGDNAGSWDPVKDRWGKAGGRVYTTALGALCLEVYYRYGDALNSFGVAPDLDELFLQ
jgi:hypothetical protein